MSTSVFITGGNTGLGFEIVKALALSSTTYKIYLGSRSIARGQEAVKALQTAVPATKTKVIAVQIDVTDDASVQAAFEHVQSAEGKLDVLVNNAGKPIRSAFLGFPVGGHRP
ncbi:hypothetical protein HKX48_007406 [Thoreauomyces humboldtii]|nr:hypothetical protein HKX48_007406 [Thoreauomyces humboldtii]